MPWPLLNKSMRLAYARAILALVSIAKNEKTKLTKAHNELEAYSAPQRADLAKSVEVVTGLNCH